MMKASVVKLKQQDGGKRTKMKKKKSQSPPPPQRRPRGCKCCKQTLETSHQKRKQLHQQLQRLWETNGDPGLGWWSDAEQAAAAAAYQFEKAQREQCDKEQKERQQQSSGNENESTSPDAAPPKQPQPPQLAYDHDAFLFGGIGDFVLPRAQPITEIQDKNLAKQIASFAKARTKEAAKNHAYNHDVASSSKRSANAPKSEAYQEAVSKMALFDYEELQLGELLGVGGFSHVYEITGFNVDGSEKHDDTSSVSSGRAASSTSITPLSFSEALGGGSKLTSPPRKERAASLSLSPAKRPSIVSSDRRKSTGGSMIAGSNSTASRRKSKIGPATYSEQQQIAREFLAQHALRPVEDVTERGGLLDEDVDLEMRNALNGGVNQNVIITRGKSFAGSFYRPGDRSRDENSAMFQETRESLSTQLMAETSTAFFSREFQDELHNAAQGSGKTTPRYAVKHLKPSLLQEQPLPNRFAKAAMDLACEAEMLVALNHPNIVKLRGWATGGPDKLKEGKHTSYFLIMDCLTETLQDRIAAWRQKHQELYGWRRRLRHVWAKSKNAAGKCLRLKKSRRRRSKKGDSPRDKRSGELSKSSSSKSLGISGGSSITSKTAEDLLLIERIKVAYDIACALEYLHEKRVIYRDLKSTNIGFNVRGDVQIFDFGLARYLPRSEIDASGSLRIDGMPKLGEQKVSESEELRPSQSTQNIPMQLHEQLQLDNPLGEEEECFQMSHVGTRRYTAPEVDMKRPYNLKADVYSFGVVLWEIMSMSSALSKGRRISLANDHASQQSRQSAHRNAKGNAKRNRRAKVMVSCSCWPLAIQQLVASMMSDDIKSRPTMKHVRTVLEQVYVSLTTDNPDDPDSQEMHLLKRQRRRSTFCMDQWAREAKHVMADFLEDEDENDDDVLPALDKHRHGGGDDDPLTKSARSHTSHLTNELSMGSVVTSSIAEQ